LKLLDKLLTNTNKCIENSTSYKLQPARGVSKVRPSIRRRTAAGRGHWIVLQNAHLLAGWLTTLEKLLAGMQKPVEKDVRLAHCRDGSNARLAFGPTQFGLRFLDRLASSSNGRAWPPAQTASVETTSEGVGCGRRPRVQREWSVSGRLERIDRAGARAAAAAAAGRQSNSKRPPLVTQETNTQRTTATVESAQSD
jgi:hypothetical protein